MEKSSGSDSLSFSISVYCLIHSNWQGSWIVLPFLLLLSAHKTWLLFALLVNRGTVLGRLLQLILFVTLPEEPTACTFSPLHTHGVWWHQSLNCVRGPYIQYVSAPALSLLLLTLSDLPQISAFPRLPEHRSAVPVSFLSPKLESPVWCHGGNLWIRCVKIIERH